MPHKAALSVFLIFRQWFTGSQLIVSNKNSLNTVSNIRNKSQAPYNNTFVFSSYATG
jgi:hypothetical protein